MAEKRDYTMSPAARKQRHGAPWQHGGFDSTALGQLMPPCQPSKCPKGKDGFPCDIRRTADEDGEGIDRCPIYLGKNAGRVTEMAEAFKNGDVDYFCELTALPATIAFAVLNNGLADLLRNGLTIEEVELYQGEIVDDVVRHKTNPSAKPTIDLLQLLGVTADQMRVTPKSQGEHSVEESFATLADRMAERRKHLDGDGS